MPVTPSRGRPPVRGATTSAPSGGWSRPPGSRSPAPGRPRTPARAAATGTEDSTGLSTTVGGVLPVELQRSPLLLEVERRPFGDGAAALVDVGDQRFGRLGAGGARVGGRHRLDAGPVRVVGFPAARGGVLEVPGEEVPGRVGVAGQQPVVAGQ